MSTYFEGHGVDPNPMEKSPVKDEVILVSPAEHRCHKCKDLVCPDGHCGCPAVEVHEMPPLQPLLPGGAVKVGKLYFGRSEKGQLFIFDGVRGFYPHEETVEAALQAILDDRRNPKA